MLQVVGDFVRNRWMLPADAPAALDRMLDAGIATGAIKRDPVFEKMLLNAGTPLDRGLDAVSTVAPGSARTQ